MAAGDEAEVANHEKIEQPAPRTRRYVADVCLDVVRAVAEEGFVEQHPEWAVPVGKAGLQPPELGLLFQCSRPKELRVQGDDLPRASIERPAVGSEDAAVVVEPCEVQRVLARCTRLERIVADVVIAWNEVRRHGKTSEDTARRDELVGVARAIGGDVAEVDDQIGPDRLDPASNDAPVVRERGGPRSEMSVRDEDDPHTGMLPPRGGSIERLPNSSCRRNRSPTSGGNVDRGGSICCHIPASCSVFPAERCDSSSSARPEELAARSSTLRWLEG